jgi:hypothetical protein
MLEKVGREKHHNDMMKLKVMRDVGEGEEKKVLIIC